MVDSDPTVTETHYNSRYGRKQFRSPSRRRTFSRSKDRSSSSSRKDSSDNSRRERSQSNSSRKYSQEKNIQYLVRGLKEVRKDIIDLKKAAKEKDESIKTCFSFIPTYMAGI